MLPFEILSEDGFQRKGRLQFSKQNMRIETPALVLPINNYLIDIGIYNETFVINNAFYNWGQFFLYNRSTLQGVLDKTGFIEPTWYKPVESDDINLRGIEIHK